MKGGLVGDGFEESISGVAHRVGSGTGVLVIHIPGSILVQLRPIVIASQEFLSAGEAVLTGGWGIVAALQYCEFESCVVGNVEEALVV